MEGRDFLRGKQEHGGYRPRGAEIGNKELLAHIAAKAIAGIDGPTDETPVGVVLIGNLAGIRVFEGTDKGRINLLLVVGREGRRTNGLTPLLCLSTLLVIGVSGCCEALFPPVLVCTRPERQPQGERDGDPPVRESSHIIPPFHGAGHACLGLWASSDPCVTQSCLPMRRPCTRCADCTEASGQSR